MQGNVQFSFLLIFILLVAIVSLVFIIWLMAIYMRTQINRYTQSYEEVEIIRRHLPSIIKVLYESNKIMDDNEKMVLPLASSAIIYDFKKLKEMQKLTIYAIALISERYELLSELNKAVDDEFRSKIPVMVDIINSLSNIQSIPKNKKQWR